MIHLIVSSLSPRLHYTAELVFRQIMGAEYNCVLLKDYHPDRHPCAINYTQSIMEGAFSIPNAGLLKSDNIEGIDTRVSFQKIPYLFRFTASAISYELSYDIFSAIFYLVSEYEKYLAYHPDRYDRYDPTQYASHAYQFEHFPLVHLYVEELRIGLKMHFPNVSFQHNPPVFTYEISFDIDFPWKYLHKGIFASLGGLAKDLLQLNWTRIQDRLSAWLTGKDPNDTFDRILELCSPDHTRFFFLIGRNSPHDSRFTWKHPSYRKLIKRIDQHGFGIGIHPSFTTYLDHTRIQDETRALADIVQDPINISRQHFLRYRLPETFRYLSKAGIEHDYTQCLFETGGFPNGMAMPYRWFDLQANQPSSLMLHPTQIMDRTLMQYMKLSPEAAYQRIQELISTTQQHNGTFTLLLHNDCLSDSDEWKGWKNMFETVIKALEEG